MDINIEIYIGLVLLINRIVAGFFTPILEFMKLERSLLMYISWIMAGLVIFATGLNLFAEIILDPIVGQVLTAVAIGGGSNILHDVVSG
jgi:hypothetical protein